MDVLRNLSYFFFYRWRESGDEEDLRRFAECFTEWRLWQAFLHQVRLTTPEVPRPNVSSGPGPHPGLIEPNPLPSLFMPNPEGTDFPRWRWPWPGPGPVAHDEIYDEIVMGVAGLSMQRPGVLDVLKDSGVQASAYQRVIKQLDESKSAFEAQLAGLM